MSLIGYDEISLKLFCEISENGELQKLVKKGNPTQGELFEAWEDIVSKNSEVQGGGYSLFFYAYQSYVKLINDYIGVKTAIIKASISNDIKKDDPLFDFLENRGFRVKRSNDKEFKESLIQVGRASENLITRIKMKKKEIEKFNKGGGKVEFIHLIANLSTAIAPVIISEDIKLCLYNEYCKILKERERNRAKRPNNG